MAAEARSVELLPDTVLGPAWEKEQMQSVKSPCVFPGELTERRCTVMESRSLGLERSGYTPNAILHPDSLSPRKRCYYVDPKVLVQC